MRVMYSITNLFVGGAPSLLVALANEMSKTNKTYIYCYSDAQVDRDVTSRISPRIKVIIFPEVLKRIASVMQRFFEVFDIKIDALYQLKRLHMEMLIKWRKIDVIHSHLYHSDDFITRIFSDWEIPIILTEHGCYNYVLQDGVAKAENIRRIFGRVDGVAYISESNRERIVELTGDNEIPFIKMNNGIPRVEPDADITLRLKEALNIHSKDFVFGMIARGIKEKGWEIAAAAFKELQKETDRQMHLVFIGDSPYLRQLKTQLMASAVRNIHFIGNTAEPVKWIACFDVGLLPSYFAGESVPMAIIEYLACGKPVIATNVGEIKEMIFCENEYAGILFDYKADFETNVKQMKDAMALYLHDSGVLGQQRKIAARCFLKFDITNVCRAYEEFYNRQIAGRRSRVEQI